MLKCARATRASSDKFMHTLTGTPTPTFAQSHAKEWRTQTVFARIGAQVMHMLSPTSDDLKRIMCSKRGRLLQHEVLPQRNDPFWLFAHDFGI